MKQVRPFFLVRITGEIYSLCIVKFHRELVRYRYDGESEKEVNSLWGEILGGPYILEATKIDQSKIEIISFRRLDHISTAISVDRSNAIKVDWGVHLHDG